jgi:predicted nicotinamide N-methyase
MMSTLRDPARLLSCPDGLRLTAVPLVSEISLYLPEDERAFRIRMQDEADRGLSAPYSPPFWSSAWAGGQALARYVLDHDVVAGRRVLDIASGSGLVAIAAARAGAARVVANDVDWRAIAAIGLNAQANGVRVATRLGDLLCGDGGDAEVVLAGDVLYTPDLVDRMGAFFERVAARGGRVYVGDPARGGLSHPSLEVVISYRVSMLTAPEDVRIDRCQVLQPRGQTQRFWGARRG